MASSASELGREVKIGGVSLAGLVSCVPAKEISNSDFLSRFSEAEVKDVIKMIGVQSRRWVDEKTTTRDLCKAAGSRLLTDLGWSAESVDAIIFVSQTPDFRLPATACALQADFGLSSSCIAFDVNLGCSGYPYALWLGMMLIQSRSAERVLLAVGDTISRIVNPLDRSTAFLFGDAGTVTALERSSIAENACFVLGTDGAGAHNLIVPRGGFRDYTESSDKRLNGKDPMSLFMDGGEIFNFTLRSVPPLIAKTIELSNKPVSSFDYFLFHQANLFMLKHLAKKSSLPIDRVPFNIDRFGNTSSASIPLLMTTALRDRLAKEATQLAMFGFGVGYSWGGVSISVGPLKVVETIEL